jgi:hypothetical protein
MKEYTLSVGMTAFAKLATLGFMINVITKNASIAMVGHKIL